MIRDHRPYLIKKNYRRLEKIWVRRFLQPQLTRLGAGFEIVRPWHVEIFGGPINIGRSVNIIASRDMPVRIAVWSDREGEGRIDLGDYVLVCPGVRIGSALGIYVADNVMLASRVYVTDSDWHDLYNRTIPSRNPAPVIIEENAWVGDSAIVCKGVTIGRNSVVGAGSVVRSDVPANTVAAGNPARVIKKLNPDERMVTRSEWYKSPAEMDRDIDYLDRESLRGNTFVHWIRHLLSPAPGE